MLACSRQGHHSLLEPVAGHRTRGQPVGLGVCSLSITG